MLTDLEKLQEEYDEYKGEYKEFQNEIFSMALTLQETHKDAIHIAGVYQRPNNDIKTWDSVLGNVNNPDKYQDCNSLLDIKDLAGVRVVCHCEDDLENFAQLLEGSLKQKYPSVITEQKGGDQNTGKSKPPYRAFHINCSKETQKNGKKNLIMCEVQLRTVMAEAWAIQDRKYVYGKTIEGEAHDLTTAVGEIMKGCEKLWSLVKSKSKSSKADVTEAIKQINFSTGKTLAAQERKFVVLTAWFDRHYDDAKKGFDSLGLRGFMEVRATPIDIGLNVSKKDLNDKAKTSTIDTFGWPIAVNLNSPEYVPKPDVDGIFAKVSIKGKSWTDSTKDENTYDYWAINSNGGFFLYKSIFEDSRGPNNIFFNTRIVRITETLMYLRNLYSAIGMPSNAEFKVLIKHGGMKGRTLGSSSPRRSLHWDYKTSTDEYSTEVITSIDEINGNIVDVVEKFTKPLFELFDFFELNRGVLEDIVVNYVNGKVV